jgi:hypothetical protein
MFKWMVHQVLTDSPKLHLNLDKNIFGLVRSDELSARCERIIREGLIDGQWAPMAKSDTSLTSHFYHWIQTQMVHGGVTDSL